MEIGSNLRIAFPLLLLLMSEFIYNINGQLVECVKSDRDALMDFKKGLNDPENRLSSWKGSNCCQWQGVVCDIATGAVTEIDLGNSYISFIKHESQNLSGEISPSLTRLKSLRYLDLSDNNFKGIPIPSFFGSMKNLQYLDVSYAGFGGKLPPSLGNISSLQHLDMTGLNLAVDSLEWISGLGSLDYISMGGLNLSIVESNWMSIVNKLPYLTELHMRDCHLPGPIPPLTTVNFTSLSVIDLSENKLHSQIPNWLVNISSLTSITMSHCCLYGGIPTSFGHLNKLRFLHLDDNKLTGELPSSFQNLSSLETLVLGNNRLVGNIPSWIGTSFPHLIFLSLRSNVFSGAIPELPNLVSLRILDLSQNKLKGSVLIMFHYLKAMILSSDTTVVFRRIRLKFFGVINLSGNELYGDFPQEITELSGLLSLNLSTNYISGRIPEEISNMVLLEALDLSNNKLVGPIPPSMSQLSFLSILDLSNNNLLGRIPIGKLFDSFDASAYTGNHRLCGAPLSVKCEEEADSSVDEGGKDEDESDTANDFINEWFYLSVGLGFAAGVLVPCFILIADKIWSDAYFQMVDKIVNKISLSGRD